MSIRSKGRMRNFSFPGHYREYRDSDSTTTVTSVHNVQLANVLAKQKSSLIDKNMFMLYYCLLVATLCSCVNGYDTSLMGSINSYQQYRSYFGFDLHEGTPATGIVYAIFVIGNIVGSFAAGPACDVKGRRIGMFIGSLVGIVGSVIQATCVNLAGFMVGRFIVGFGVAISATAGPSYVSEMAHPAYRGSMTAIYNCFWWLGGIPGTFIPYATSGIPTSMSWRIPLWLQLIYGGLVLLLCLWLPESPRWLVANDRHNEALDVMAKYHGNNDRNSPVVLLEYREMCDDISNIGADKRWWDYRELWNTREVRYRSMLVIITAFFGQWVGNGLVSYYYPAMVRRAGVTEHKRQLLLQGFHSVVSFVGAITGALLTDRWGRRQQLMTTTGLVVIIFAIIMALNATNIEDHDASEPTAKDPTVAKIEIAFIFIFGFVYSMGWTPNQAMYPVECLRYESRAKGMGMYNFFVNIAQFYNTFVTGIALEKAGWKYYFLFIGWDAFEVIIIYFFFVETKKRTLEELTEIFQSRDPVKASLKQTRVVLRGTTVTELKPRKRDRSYRRVSS
ncbi:hypothetical protein AJ80_04257 [Polytolypa hystricis UAMH7299]|uniref:Major facilitator superfamily (MFS) profile domain-containing protein n=1 Tax=Polytolypa hystricis (strain UAMH7299) TaxID=1447883 RepID=A0A2B7YCK8_POLH7|nr:hypothetical protein AJ80_04257 [Polytolypa hystricis UAMH7299]